ncbi:MAG: hypothetical protein Q7S43_01020 [bacterium]|nr:hypothetical protein [bacterium]
MNGKDGLKLLPGTKRKLGIKVPGENRFLYAGSAIMGAVLVTMFALGRYQASLEKQVELINNQLVESERARDKKGEQNLKVLNERMNLVANILAEHIYWTKAFSLVESLLQGQVRFKSFSGITDDSKITVQGQATSYTVLAKQLAAFFTDRSIVDISLGKVSVSPDGTVEFGLEITFDKSRLIQQK